MTIRVATGRSSTWLRVFAPANAGSPLLVCFPHAGGSAGVYRPLALALAPDVEVVAVQYPGRQDRRDEPPAGDLRALADGVADALGAQARPFALFGHSMGAIVGYETAVRIAANSLPRPVRLFVSGRAAPEPDGRQTVPADDMALLREIRRLGGTVGAVLDDPELRELALPALRADYAALGRYSPLPAPRLTMPITVLRGHDDPLVTAPEAEAWRTRTVAGSDTRVFPGGHFYLNDNMPGVAALVRGRLAGRVDDDDSVASCGRDGRNG
ncbi:thioesterase II family protein [Pseudofrankia asymbiotica]|uniref:Thioesterase TesA-like domain-containing protein n=1 Tax=Pseudofrankia asymbiotica TaxID=1834516 RepID=A0A1V2I1L3_9ACTN|nr:alpha/beta fold hydrolase [Pseudofrankia asymbiotica]ONH23414.1 hypothetical protein BL253_32950 [Pseudofrankia asymbiotica]